jgi:hypothetical protein
MHRYRIRAHLGGYSLEERVGLFFWQLRYWSSDEDTVVDKLGAYRRADLMEQDIRREKARKRRRQFLAAWRRRGATKC